MGFFDHDRQLSSVQDGSAPPMLWYPRADVCGCRLSLDRTRAIPIGDQTGKTVIYVVPHKSDTIECWSGEDWVPRKVPYDLGTNQTRAILALDISGCAKDTVYDVFVRNISGPWEIKYIPWNSATARATSTGPDMNPDGLGVCDGRPCFAASQAARVGGRLGVQPDWLYLGTFYTSAAGQTEDSATKRFVWNMHNRVPTWLYRNESAASWTYASTTLRQANANSANKVELVRGLNVDRVDAVVLSASYCAASGTDITVGIGISSTTVDSSIVKVNYPTPTDYDGNPNFYAGLPGLGYQYLAWLESAGTNFGSGGPFTVTFYGTQGQWKSGLLVKVLA